MRLTLLCRLVAVTIPAICAAVAAPFSTARRVDFYNEVSSRNLAGLATRSDGRLLSAAVVSQLPDTLDATLLWSVAANDQHVYVGTGPDGNLFQLDAQSPAGTSAVLAAKLPDAHIFALATLPGGGVLAGTSPHALLALVRDGKVVAQTRLPVGSILDLLVFADPDTQQTIALVATGAPGRIYRVDLSRFEAAAITTDTVLDLSTRGVTEWATVRDDNVRTLLRLPDGRVIAGSAPKGNVYQFEKTGGAPRVLEENTNSEVTDLLAWEGGFFAAITQTPEPREARVNRTGETKSPTSSADAAKDDKTGNAAAPTLSPAASKTEKFRGRADLVWFPDQSFPETVASRNETAFYQLRRHQDWVLITAGEEGELLGYDPAKRFSLTFAGAVSAQVNAIQAFPDKPGQFLLVGNNPAGLELMNFATSDTRSARTRTIDLGVPSELGALRFDRNVAEQSTGMAVEMRASYGSDEQEGWTNWRAATENDGGWSVADLRGRYLQIRLNAAAANFAIGAATLFTRPQNQRPRLQSFHVISPNFALVPPPARAQRVSTTLGQVLQGGGREHSNDNLLDADIIPQPGTQIIVWAVEDPDHDTLISTLSLQGPGENTWTDVAVNTMDSYAQFDFSHLPEGVYRTRLVVNETLPRPADQRRSASFETDDLVVDRTPPKILEAAVTRHGENLQARVRARDQLTLLAGAEFNFNSGARYYMENPEDGILDGREEIFSLEFTPAQLGGATAVEIVIYDQNGNSEARRIALPTR